MATSLEKGFNNSNQALSTSKRGVELGMGQVTPPSKEPACYWNCSSMHQPWCAMVETICFTKSLQGIDDNNKLPFSKILPTCFREFF